MTMVGERSMGQVDRLDRNFTSFLRNVYMKEVVERSKDKNIKNIKSTEIKV
jgi:hypothetical protein